MPNRHKLHAPARASRREFLRTSTALLGTATAGSLAISRAAHAAGESTLKIGLVGCGGRGTGAAANALRADKSVKLTAMADAFDDVVQNSRTRLRKLMGDQVSVDDDHCFAGFDACQKLIQSGVDVVLLATPPHFRPAHIEACVKAGKHVFAEKPMAVDAPGVHRVLAAGEEARKKKVSVVSGFETRYARAAREAVKRLHDGAVGDILAIEGIYNTGFLWHRGRKPEWSEMQYQMRNWYYFTWLSGDHLVEQYVHLLDFASWIMHEQPPLKAWGLGGRQVRTDPKFGDIFDHHAVVYEYPNGVRLYAYCRQQGGCYNNVSNFILGTKGRCKRDRLLGYRIEGQTNWQSDKTPEDADLNTFVETLAAIRAGNPINDSVAMARSSMLAIMGRMATYSGQLIEWDQAFGSKQVLAPQRYAWDADPPVLPRPDHSYPQAIPGVTKVL